MPDNGTSEVVMPRIPTVHRVRSLLLVVTLACVACASHHEHLPPQELLKANIEAMQEAVPSKISDPARAARVNKAIDALRQQLLSFDSVQATFRSNTRALNARPDATRSEFETLVKQFDEKRIAVRRRFFELHSEMIAATTEAEWKDLSPYEQRLLTETEER